MSHRVLAVNVGSSSLKVSTFDVDATNERPLLQAAVERIGTAAARLTLQPTPGSPSSEERISAADIRAATSLVLGRLRSEDVQPDAIVHRLVHGGTRHVKPEWLTSSVLSDLNALRELAPEHLPAALDAIAVAHDLYPAVPQAACYDTAFHRTLPDLATTYAVPARYRAAGLRRFGFHGLSCEFVMRTLGRVEPVRASGRVIVAHLGSGASLTAVSEGRSIETTMGFTPMGGVVMGTRVGDVDPGAVIFAARCLDQDPSSLERALGHESGLYGVSETTADVRDLLSREANDPRAALALALFCYSITKAIGALAAVLQGLDTFVFTGGIGEHAADIRQRIGSRLGWLGVEIAPDRNLEQQDVISADSSQVMVRRLATNEDAMLARHAGDLLERTERHV